MDIEQARNIETCNSANNIIEIENQENQDNAQVVEEEAIMDLPKLAVKSDITNSDIILAIFVSVAGFSAIIFVLYYFDDTLRLVEDIETDVGIPVIAKVYRDNNGFDLKI